MILNLFFLFSIFNNANASLSEKHVLTHVLTQFPSVKMAQNDLSIAEGEQTASRGAFDILLQGGYQQNSGDYENETLNAKIIKPTALFGLDLYAGFKKSNGNLAIYDEELKTLDRGEWSLGVKLPLLRDFLIDEKRAKLQKANLNKEQRNFQLRTAEIEHIRTALHRYWDWVFAAKRVQVQKNLLATAEARDKWLLKRMKAGDIAQFERNDNLRSILQRNSSVLQSELGFEQAIAELGYYMEGSEFTHLMQQPQNIPLDYAPLQNNNIASLSIKDLTQLALQQRPELKSINFQIEQNKIDEKLQDNKFLPKLDLQAQYSKDEGLGSSSLDDDNVKAMLTLEVPLQYRAIRGRQSQIRGQTQKFLNQKQLIQQRISADIKIIKKNLEVALQRRELAKQEFALAEKLEKGERIRLSQGETNVLIVNLREQATAEAELRFAETSIEAIKQFISLNATVGQIPNLN